ncbi:MAG: dolichyl-phosphate beta-D-mannosyltransferase [Candidatus Woykebacteria bacterium RBG_13_40_7b]|uniref:Dolichyl-phosphate beta-D-mannosyltransferase n=1 Tax=Candidatus Woykebacteria bacterium RBG_13_40_7b TaxID=1802594 RepID=A0A1G1W787_9BACT|nr:MAG: dolichyl-phosphate beta-D-mannosyltransferase [Candidatus Woykebacteria bacterium RBG_13_40_7b]
MKVVVIIPTYNEKENVSLLIPQLENEFKKIPQDMSILIVDDSSPDGTAEVVQKLQKQFKNLHLVTGEKQGLGAAYVRGMRYAIQDVMADAIMEMDADFSHKVEDVPRLVSALDEGYDFVIGSRYIRGGKIPNWPLSRRLLSGGGNIISRVATGMYKIHDTTAGFRAIRCDLLKKINLENIKVQGYSFQINLLYQAYVNQAKIKEVPVEFIDRKVGETKIGKGDVVEALLYVWIIRLQKSETFIKFAIVGTSGMVVNLGLLTILLNLGVNKYIASPIAIEISIISNFLFNNFWTFGKRDTESKIHIKGLRFNLVSFVALGVSYATFVKISLLFPDVPPQVAQFIGIMPATIINYLLNTYWTFKEKPTVSETS